MTEAVLTSRSQFSFLSATAALDASARAWWLVTALERVFEPFYRLESSRSRDSGGTGLGLSIARDIAQAHGGTLTLRNRPQGGLTAELRLPRK